MDQLGPPNDSETFTKQEWVVILIGMVLVWVGIGVEFAEGSRHGWGAVIFVLGGALMGWKVVVWRMRYQAALRAKRNAGPPLPPPSPPAP